MSQQQPGQTFFKAVLTAANLYLIAVALDGALSLIDDGLHALSAPVSLGGLRNTVAGLVVAATALMVPLLVVVPRLPKTIYLPLVLFVLWGAFGAPPLLSAAEPGVTRMLVLDGLELALAAAIFIYVRTQTGMWLLPAEALPSPSNAGMKIVAWAAATVIVLPVFMLSLLVLNLGSMIEAQTAGYIHFSTSGIDLKETVLRKGGKSITLVGMLHVGEPKFYDALYASFPRGALLLEEGVTDRNKRLAGNLSYRKFARVLGLEQQPALTPRIAPPPAGAQEPSESSASAAEPPAVMPRNDGTSVLRPDIDISEFSDSTIDFLSRVSEIYQANGFLDALMRIETVMNQTTTEQIKSFYQDVVYKRNGRVLATVDTELAHYDAIVIPWGAMHMPGLEKEIKARGFTIESQRRLPLVRYSIMAARLQGR